MNSPGKLNVLFPCRFEGVLVPHVVQRCVEEVERRGMEEVGIYRISGTSSEINTLKAAFNSSKNKHDVVFGVEFTR